MSQTAILTRPVHESANQQNLLLFRIYVGYRSLLSIVLLIMLVSPNTRQLVGVLNPNLYVTVALAYLATSALLLGSLAGKWRYNQRMLFAVFFIDIVAIVLMTDASGGMQSGLPVLLVITVAAAAVMIPNRTLATLIAAVSVLATLADTVWLILRNALDVNSLFPVGLLGLLIFGVSLMVQFIAARLGKAEELARSGASDLYNLQRLNEQIVQHMQTGILLVSENGTVRVMNKAASMLLSPERPITMEQGRRLQDYSEELARQFEHWQSNGQHRAQPFQVTELAPQVIAHFRELQPGSERKTLIFIEDYTAVTQYAQSLKLNSLGRLTASIAHEIRNPLGAISHAAQLMMESPGLTESDSRLADIIQHHSRRVNQTVESVMQISRREPPKPEYIPLCSWLPEFVGNYLDGLRSDADITVDCSYPDLLVEFDQENLQRVLGNLLDNALRHSKMATGREQARIEVALDFSKHQCLIDVIDQGSGVPPQERSKLFEPFYTTVQEGSGMGLFLCKELCEINDAGLYYRSTDRNESCFRVALNQRDL